MRPARVRSGGAEIEAAQFRGQRFAIRQLMARIGQLRGVAALGLLVYAKLLQRNAGQQPDPPHPLPFID